MSKPSVLIRFSILIFLASLTSSQRIPGYNDSEIFKMMFEAQDLFRNDNYRKRPREFDKDWEGCEETYRWPECCLWSQKRNYERGTADCNHIKGDVILENDEDANVFQAFVGIKEIQGSLVLRNTSLLAFGMPHITNIGFKDSNPNKIRAALIVENNPYLLQFRMRRLKKIEKHKSQKYGIIENNLQLVIDSKQYQILMESSDNKEEGFEKFKPPKDRYIRYLISELYPYFLFGVMIIGVFTHHFIMIEVNESRVKRKEKEMIECMVQMRDSTLAAELLLQTPSDVLLSFDKDVLHLCTDQVELIKQIQKLLDADVQAFKENLEEVTPKE